MHQQDVVDQNRVYQFQHHQVAIPFGLNVEMRAAKVSGHTQTRLAAIRVLGHVEVSLWH